MTNGNGNDECADCRWNVGGACTNRNAQGDWGECGHYEGCLGWAAKKEAAKK